MSLGHCSVFAQNYVTMRTMRQVAVYGAPDKSHRPVARIHFDAVLEVENTGKTKGCKKGWGRLKSGGFVCLASLKATTLDPAPSPYDNPDVDGDIERYVVTKGGAVSFPNIKWFGERRPGLFLHRGTVLAVKKTIVRGGTLYLITRDGQYIRGDNVEKMAPIWRLGKKIVDGEPFVLGYFINADVESRSEPSDSATVVRKFAKFDVIEGHTLLESTDGWVKLPDDGFVKDSDFARVRTPVTSFTPADDEKWIAVDLQEQTVVGYLGQKRVFVALASTGKKGNTARGSYRVKWKRRLQTMRLHGGHVRVEDVQWVMYYIPELGFALHTAWHNNFGHPVSHGCVNLPRDDARWFYEWATPTSYPFESEDFDTDFEKGTRVIVF
ncbi:MAG: L,D-transpeptidase [Deltaproteobacteria bacterium]|nr:L,D-transpeptidase [Deltaproteobacteria bacterium]